MKNDRPIKGLQSVGSELMVSKTERESLKFVHMSAAATVDADTDDDDDDNSNEDDDDN